ncbi:MAG: hypothetical protein ACR2LF_09660 [Jatrophihabitantaceae bacterium]
MSLADSGAQPGYGADGETTTADGTAPVDGTARADGETSTADGTAPADDGTAADATVATNVLPEAPATAPTVPASQVAHAGCDLAQLETLGRRPLVEHAEVYQQLHTELQRALSEIDGI